MKLLLDTHAFIWWMEDSPRLPRSVRRAIADGGNDVAVSAVSVFEIAVKVRLGTLSLDAELAGDVAAAIRDQAFVGLDVTPAHAQRAGAMPGVHRDPFDRLLIAQALAEDLVLVSGEGVFDAFGVRRMW